VIMREIGDRQGKGAILTNLGEISVEQGSWPATISFFEQAIHIALELGERNIEVYARNARGEAYRRTGDPTRAAGDQQAALAVVRETGDRYGEAVVLWHLGLTFRDLDQRQRAQSCWKDALAILEEFGSAQAEDVRRLLEGTDGARGRPPS
jgi:tetratricopeptide (TPR) repeat protein